MIFIHLAIWRLQTLVAELGGRYFLDPFPKVSFLLFHREVKGGKIPDLNREVRGCDLTLIDVFSNQVLIHSEVPDQDKEEEDDKEINADDNQADVTLAEEDFSLVQHILEGQLT